MPEMTMSIVSTQFGQTIEGFDQVFEGGEVVVLVSDEETRILLPLSPDLANTLGLSLLEQARKARKIKRMEATESILRSSKEGK